MGKILQNKLLYKIVFIVVGMFTAVPYIQQEYGKFVKVLLVWGLLIVAYDLITDYKHILKDKMVLLLLAFLAFSGFTIGVMRSENFAENIKEWLYMLIFFLVIFRVNGKTREEIKKEIRLIAYTILICTAILSSLCMFTYFMGISDSYKVGRTVIYVGISGGRLWGLYNPNVGASIAIVSIVLSAFAMFTIKRKCIRVLLILNLLVQYSVLILSGSRTIQYGFVICSVVLTFGMLPLVVKKWSGMSVKHVLLRGGIAIVTAGLLLVLFKVSLPALSALPRMQTEVVNAAQEETKASSDKYSTEIGRKDTGADTMGGVLNGRQYLWGAAGKILSEYPVLGVGYENIYQYGVDGITHKYYKNVFRRAGLLNGYLTILCASGILGGIWMLWFFVSLMWKLLKKSGKIRQIQGNEWLIASAFLVLLFLLTELFEARILYVVNVNMVLFWSIAGYARSLTADKEGVTE